MGGADRATADSMPPGPAPDAAATPVDYNHPVEAPQAAYNSALNNTPLPSDLNLPHLTTDENTFDRLVAAPAAATSETPTPTPHSGGGGGGTGTGTGKPAAGDKAVPASACSAHIPSGSTLVHTAGTGKPPRLMVYDVGGRRMHEHHLRPAKRQEKLTRMLKDLFKRHDENGEVIDNKVKQRDDGVSPQTSGSDGSRATTPVNGASGHGSSAAHGTSVLGISTHGASVFGIPMHGPSAAHGSSSAHGTSSASSANSTTSHGTPIHRTNSEELDQDAADAVEIASRGDQPPSLLSLLAQQLKKRDSKPDEILEEMLSKRSVSTECSLVERYGHLSSVVGKGSFGVVRIAQKSDPQNKHRKLVYAVKEYHPNQQESESKYMKRLASEFCLASSLRHTNIIQTLDLLKEGRGKYFGVMEYCAGGDLYSLIVVAGKLEPIEADCFFKQIMRGVAYMHEMGVAHRDLKPENVLLTSRGCCKLTDFGNAECFRMAWENKVHLSSTLAGSGPYIAPEEYKKQSFDPRAVDIWAAGVIYMAMCTGRHLWQEAKQSDSFYMNYLEGRKDENGYEPIERLKLAKRRNVIYSVLDPVASRRLTAKQVLNSEWGREIVVCEAGEGHIGHI